MCRSMLGHGMAMFIKIIGKAQRIFCTNKPRKVHVYIYIVYEILSPYQNVSSESTKTYQAKFISSVYCLDVYHTGTDLDLNNHLVINSI